MPADETFEIALGFAEVAFGHMRRLGHVPHPRNYTLWYNYAAGVDPSLVDAVDAALAGERGLSEHDVAAIHDLYLLSNADSDDGDPVGNTVRQGIDRMVGLMATSHDIMARYAATLTTLAGSGQTPQTADAMAPVLEATRQVQDVSGTMEQSLRESRIEILKLQGALAAIRAESMTDRNTLLTSRNLFDLQLARMVRQGQPFALAITDIDHFKSFNDRFGHLTGDQVLRLVAGAVKASVRPTDIAARYGGEEFAIIMPDTDLATATEIAGKVRRAVMTKELVQGSSGENLGRVTISIGVSASRPDDCGLSIIDRADRCLYAAKHGGRNQVVSEADPQMLDVASRVA